MPTASQYQLTHQELTEAIIKAVGVHEGKWQLMVTFGFGALNTGPSETEVMPGGLVAVQKVGIAQATPESPAALVVDAAEVNPAPQAEARPTGKRRARA
jgi:hypothetical protein